MTRTIAAVLFPEFEMLDLYGPLEMFSFFRDDFEIRTVASTAGPVFASGGPATVAQDAMADGRDYDILLVPGGRGTRYVDSDAEVLGWLARQTEQAERVTSVCTGSLLLAKAGVLNGRRATTNKLAFDWVADQISGVDWQRSARWVRDGKFYTSSGVSAGMDMALALIADLLGEEAAEQASMWAEYVRNPDPGNDPFEIKESET
ncbi:MAG: DJ-1/PfpI family protein [Paracoccaceae bacterium]